MASLYELTAGLQTLWDLMEEGTLEEEMLLDAFKNQEEEISIKIEGYCKFIKNLESDIAGLKAEEERLKDKRKTMENTIDRAKKAMQMAMETAGEKKVKGQIFTISIQANPPAVVMDEQYLENIPERYLIPQEPKLDRKKIAEDIKAGEDLNGIAHLDFICKANLAMLLMRLEIPLIVISLMKQQVHFIDLFGWSFVIGELSTQKLAKIV